MIKDEKYVKIVSSPAEKVKTEVNVNNQDITITQNGNYQAEPPYTGFGLVSVAVPNGTERLSVTQNGTFRPSGANIGFDEVNVNVDIPELITKTITANGTYNASADNADGYSSVTVNVPMPKYLACLKLFVCRDRFSVRTKMVISFLRWWHRVIIRTLPVTRC